MATPEEQGFDSEALAGLVEMIDRDELPIDSLLVARHGSLILDAYFYPYVGDRPHDVASVTKSVTSTLVGIAIDDGLLTLEETIGTIFEGVDASKRDIEIRHLLSMTSGLECGLAPGEPELFEMIGSPNFVEYALGLPVAVPPARAFAYCSPGSHLLSAAISRATGESAEAFARERLFGPLGMSKISRPTDTQGVSRGWGDLQLHPRDMAKIGQLFLDRGQWRGAEIVSSSWVAAATENVITADADGTGYGFQWWISPPPFDGIYEARGRGGQAILVWPDNDIVVVFTGRGVDVRLDVAQLLLAAFATDGPLAPNPGSNERMTAAIEQALAPPLATPVPDLPPAAIAMSGRRYRLDDNAFDTRCVLLRFDSKSDVTFALTTQGGTYEMPVGMDAVPRFGDESPTGIPIGLVGTWTSPDVFVLRYDEISGPNHLRVEVLVGEGADSIAVVFSDPGGYFPTVTVAGVTDEQCEPQ
ncbi:MAG: serine hydrolase [Polyangiales bacterium]